MKKQRTLQTRSLYTIDRLKNDTSAPLHEQAVGPCKLRLRQIDEQVYFDIALPNSYMLISCVQHLFINKGEQITLQKEDDGIRFGVSTVIGRFDIQLGGVFEDSAFFHYRVSFEPTRTLSLSEEIFDLLLLKTDYSIPEAGNVYLEQVQARSGACFLDFGKAVNGSVYYFQNLSELHGYADDSQVPLTDSVKVAWPEMGFKCPISPTSPLTKGKRYILRDTFIVYHPTKPKTAYERAVFMLKMQHEIYRRIEKPKVALYDLSSIVEKGLKDLCNHKGCWQQVKSDAFLNAYLNDYKNPAESMVQLSVLWPLLDYHGRYPSSEAADIIHALTRGIPRFYDEKLRSLVRWIPEKSHHLDNSEEQKKPRLMDSWYLHHPLLNLAFLLRTGQGNDELRDIFFDSVRFCMKVAKHFDYKWPIFYDVDTLDVVKAEAAPGEGGERDVAGLYAYLLLRAYELSGQKSYLEEAKRAARTLAQYGENVLYPANNTAYAAEALLELWSMTKNDVFLRQAEICVAHLLRNTSIWDMQYGHAKEYPTFFMLFPLKDAPYAAIYEEHECIGSFSRFLTMAYKEKAPLAPEIFALIPEYIKYALARLPFYYPPMLPDDILAQEVKTGFLNKDLWIPVEDLGDGWDEVGTVGQEVYGAGAIFQAFTNHMLPLDEDDSFCFVGCPILDIKRVKGGVRFRIPGSSEFAYPIRLLSRSKQKYVLSADGEDNRMLDQDSTEIEVAGGKTVTIKWK